MAEKKELRVEELKTLALTNSQREIFSERLGGLKELYNVKAKLAEINRRLVEEGIVTVDMMSW